jgi:TPR repeat protein
LTILKSLFPLLSELYSIAAKKGYSLSQFFLAYCLWEGATKFVGKWSHCCSSYISGRGGFSKDVAASLRWLNLAAAQGHEKAKAYLADHKSSLTRSSIDSLDTPAANTASVSSLMACQLVSSDIDDINACDAAATAAPSCLNESPVLASLPTQPSWLPESPLLMHFPTLESPHYNT